MLQILSRSFLAEAGRIGVPRTNAAGASARDGCDRKPHEIRLCPDRLQVEATQGRPAAGAISGPDGGY